MPQKCATHFREKKNMYQAPSKFCIICQLQAIGVLHKFRGYGASAREASTYISLVLFRSMFFLSFLNYCHTNNYIMYSRTFVCSKDTSKMLVDRITYTQKETTTSISSPHQIHFETLARARCAKMSPNRLICIHAPPHKM